MTTDSRISTNSMTTGTLKLHTDELLRGLQLSTLTATAKVQGATPSEADYKALWLTQLSVSDDPEQAASAALRAIGVALQGGALADCLSHVFVAGYQGAIRHVLPSTPAAQWFSLLVSEDQQDPEANPPTQLQRNKLGALVSGTKSWVASSATVDGLVVSACGDADTTQWFWCSAQDPAVTLSHRSAPSFLPDVSQGFARFDGLQISPKQLLEAKPFANFMHAESLYVGLALMGYLWRHWQQQEDLAQALVAKQEPARGFAVALAAALSDALVLAQHPNGELPLALLQSWQLRLAALLDQFELRWLGSAEQRKTSTFAQSEWAQRWWRDHRLTFMYAPLVRSHFAKATLAVLCEVPAPTPG